MVKFDVNNIDIWDLIIEEYGIKKGRYILNDEEYKKFSSEYGEIWSYIDTKFNKEDNRRIDDLINLNNAMSGIEVDYTFRDAFKMGARFIIELMGNKF